MASKYPRTPHLPFSPGIMEDDVVLPSDAVPTWLNNEVVVTEKLDGGNTCIYRGKVYARTVNMEASHPSFGPIKALASQISFMIPDNIQIFGENMFGIHSIEYDKLESYFYIFGVLEDETSWLEWDKVKELSINTGIPHVPEIARRQFTSMAELQAYIEGRMKLPSCCGSVKPEGFVIRSVGQFPQDSFEKNVVKYVRKNHVQTSDNWRQTWKQAKLNCN